MLKFCLCFSKIVIFVIEANSEVSCDTPPLNYFSFSISLSLRAMIFSAYFFRRAFKMRL